MFSLVEENSTTIMPLIFLPLYEAAKTHWNSTIVMLVCNVLKTLMEINQVWNFSHSICSNVSLKELFDELSLQLMDEENDGPVDARETIMSYMTRAESMSQAAF